MSLAQELKRRGRAAIGPIVTVGLLAYFVWHGVQGERGVLAWHALSRELAFAEATLGGLEAEREALARRVAALRAEALDRDALDERARAMLNWVGRDDMVVLYGPGGRLY